MVYSGAIRTAAQLTAEARAAAQVSSVGLGLAAYLPDHDNYSLSFDFNVNQTALTEVASFRAYSTEADYGQTQGTQARSGKLPPISRKYRVDEYEQLTLYGQNDALGDKLEQYARQGGAAIANRVEIARGQAIETGKVVISERGLIFTIDYGRKAGHTVTAGTVWSNSAATPIVDLGSWKATYIADGNPAPGAYLISSLIMATLQANPDMIKLALRRGTDLPSRISVDDVLSVLSAYGFSNVRVFDETIGGTAVISPKKVIFLPSASASVDSGALGTTDWGIPAESINPAYGIPTADRPGIFAGHFTREDPEGADVLSSAIVLPILTNADATFAAAVLS